MNSDYSFGKRNLLHIDKISRSGNANNTISIKYMDKKNNITTRIVEPYEIRNDNLWAYDTEKQGIRQFKIKNIRSVKETKNKYEPRWDIKMNSLEKKASYYKDLIMKEAQNNMNRTPENESFEANLLKSMVRYERDYVKDKKDNTKWFNVPKKIKYSKELKKLNKDVSFFDDYADFKDTSKVAFYEQGILKMAQENLQDKNGKIPSIEKALSSKVERDVATMMATSHEYKKPNVDAALALTKNYKWELSKEKVKNLQGISKPVDMDKVRAMVKNMKGKKMTPLITVDKIHGIRPQTRGKKILLDGHHRKEAYDYAGIDEVPVYKGVYTGGSQIAKNELREKK